MRKIDDIPAVHEVRTEYFEEALPDSTCAEVSIVDDPDNLIEFP